MQGTIIRFFEDRHFGFLTYSGGELFFHELAATQLEKPLKRGIKCNFDIGTFKGKKCAENLRPVVQAVADAK